jgi:hypothetical protein
MRLNYLAPDIQIELLYLPPLPWFWQVHLAHFGGLIWPTLSH